MAEQDTLSLEQQQARQDSLDFVKFQSGFNFVDDDSNVLDSLNALDSINVAKAEKSADSLKNVDKALEKLAGTNQQTSGVDKMAEKEGVGALVGTLLPFVAYHGIRHWQGKHDFTGYGNMTMGAFKQTMALRMAMHTRNIALDKVDKYNQENKFGNITGFGRQAIGAGGAAAGMGAVYTVAKGFQALHDMADVGRRTEMYFKVAENAADFVKKDIIAKETAAALARKGKGVKTAVQLSAKELKRIEARAASQAVNEGKKLVVEITENLGKNMTKAGKKKWDDVALKLVSNEKVRNKAIQWFMRNGKKKTAALLGGSVTSALFPELWSTIAGGIGIGLVAYDIYSLFDTAKDLRDIFYEDIPAEPGDEHFIGPMPEKIINSIIE